jgi:hypothetical protein
MGFTLDVPAKYLLLVWTFTAMRGVLTFVIDETLECRWRRRVAWRSHERDPLAPSRQCSVVTSDQRWIVLAWVIHLHGLAVVGPARVGL